MYITLLTSWLLKSNSVLSGLLHLIFTFLKIISPIIKIKFGLFPEKGLGFLASEPTYYALEKKMRNDTSIEIYGIVSKPANMQLYKMWKRKFLFHKVATRLHEIASNNESYKRFLVPWRNDQYFDKHGLLENNPSLLEFTSQELHQGYEFLNSLGIKSTDRFVCLSARDESYDSLFKSQECAHTNSYRNSNINDFILAAEYLSEQDIYIFRMGASINSTLDTTKKNIIDYARYHRTDFLDIFLCAHCYFFLGDGGGLVNVARVFKRPIALANWIPVGLLNTAQSKDIIIHKLLKRDGIPLTLQEQIQDSCAKFTESSDYEKHGLKVIDNSEEEILELCKQMLATLNNTWIDPEDYRFLQETYWTYYQSNSILAEPVRASIGYQFIKKHLPNNKISRP